MFVAEAVAGYVESLSERDFDVPFMALLNQLGFSAVHKVHGQYEFGKDFIAQREEDGSVVQYCFQSKAGDLNAAGWRDLAKQVHAMRTGAVVHPGFDSSLTRRLVVVVTGRLKGGAGVEFASDNDYRRSRNEETAILWDIDKLVPDLESIVVESKSAEHRARTLEILGQLGRASCSREIIADYTRSWRDSRTPKDRWADVLTCAVLARQALDQGREDFAMQLAFQLLRATWESDQLDDSARSVLETVRKLFDTHAETFWFSVSNHDPVELTTRSQSGIDTFVTHPVMSARLAESLSLFGLHRSLLGDEAKAEAVADYLESFRAFSSSG